MPNLCLTRRVGERISIADGEITIEVVKIGLSQVRILITAPRDIPVVRSELLERDERERNDR